MSDAPPRKAPLRAKLALLVFGFGLLALAELSLRLLGIGADHDPFLGFAGEAIFEAATLEDGRRGVRIRDSRQPEPLNPVELEVPKPEGVQRVFVIGGSAVYGYPRDARASLTRWLEDRLAMEAPGARVEIVNLGAMSYGSTRLASVVEQCLELEPDLVVVACGNNEYVERRVAADVKRVTPLRRALNSLYLYRLIAHIVNQLVPREQQAEALDVGAEHRVLRDVAPRTPDVDAQVLATYRANLLRMIADVRSAGARVLVSDVPTNLADWSPQESTLLGAHSEEALARWSSHRAEGDRLLALGDLHGAVAEFRRALAIDDTHAALNFALGRALLSLGELEEAQEHLRAARDLDRRPIRATAEILRTAARVARDEKAPFVHANAAFERAATSVGAPGSDLLDDYCHPNVTGHRLWAAQLASAIRDEKLLDAPGGWRDAYLEVLEAEREAVRELPTSRAVEFQQAFSAGFAAARAGQRQQAVDHYTRAIELDPSTYDAYYNRAVQFLAMGRSAEAAADCRRTIALRRDHYQAWGNLGVALLDLGELPAAVEALQQSLALQPRYVRALVNLGKANDLLGNPEHARQSLDRAIEVAPDDISARLMRAIFRFNHEDERGSLIDLDHVRSLSPDHPEAARIRAQVEAVLREQR